MDVELDKFSNAEYNPGSGIKRYFWYFVNQIFFKSRLIPIYSLKVFLLRLFGGKVGKAVLIKPGVNIKYAWFVDIGDYVWIGEGVWIDNLAKVTIGSNACISQGAFILTGNHDYKKSKFDLIVQPIVIEDGVWIGAKSVVCPGVRCGKNAVLSVGSIATKDLQANGIYQGNPAIKIKDRIISE